MSEELEFVDISDEGGQPPSRADEKPHKRGERRKRRRQINSLFRALIKLVAVAISLFLLCQFVVCPYAVHGNRMFPKLRDGDCAVVLKIGGYQKGDVVTYERNGTRYFSRIVAMPGDTVSISSQGLRINDLIQSEEIFYSTVPEEPIEETVEEGEVFLLNDYRSDSTDSRKIGSVRVSELDGKVVFLFRWRGI